MRPFYEAYQVSLLAKQIFFSQTLKWDSALQITVI